MPGHGQTTPNGLSFDNLLAFHNSGACRDELGQERECEKGCSCHKHQCLTNEEFP